jgi:hypothetical protein
MLRLGSPKCLYEDNIKINQKGMGLEVLEIHYVVHIKDDSWSLMSTETNVLFSEECGEFLEHLGDYPISKKDPFNTV